MGYNEPVRGTSNPGQRTAAAAARAPQRARPIQTPEIPDRLYFRIGDVAKLCDVPAYVLRFWETEFPQLKPNKGGTGQRLYRRREVETALRIRQLLYDEGYTIAGARQLLKTEQRQGAPQLSLIPANSPDPATLKTMRRELESLLAMLSRPAGAKTTPVPMRPPRRASVARNPGSLRMEPVLVQSLFDTTEGPELS